MHVQVMIKPLAPPEVVKPHITDVGMMPQLFSPPSPQDEPSNFASPLLPTPRGTYSSRSSLASTSYSTQGKRLNTRTDTLPTLATGSSRSSVTGSNIHIVHL